MKDEVQIALYKKDALSYAEKNIYTVDYADENNNELPLLLLFGMFMDSIFYKNHNQVSGLKHERNIVFNDKFSERALWQPEEQMVE